MILITQMYNLTPGFSAFFDLLFSSISRWFSFSLSFLCLLKRRRCRGALELLSGVSVTPLLASKIGNGTVK